MLLKKLGWLALAVAGAVAWAMLALHRGETVSAGWLVLAAVGTSLLAYRFYSRFLATTVFGLNDRRATPAERLMNGRDFVPTTRWVLFAITLLLLPVPDRWWARYWRPSSVICLAPSGSSSAWCWAAQFRISSSSSARCGETASRWDRWPRRRPDRSPVCSPWWRCWRSW